MPEKLSHEEFVKKAIISLRKEEFKGIHMRYLPEKSPVGRSANEALRAMGLK